MRPEEIRPAAGGKPVSYDSENADWGSKFRGFKLYVSPEPLKQWIIIYSQKDGVEAKAFLQALKQSFNGLGVQVDEPKAIVIPDTKAVSYVGAAGEVNKQKMFRL